MRHTHTQKGVTHEELNPKYHKHTDKKRRSHVPTKNASNNKKRIRKIREDVVSFEETVTFILSVVRNKETIMSHTEKKRGEVGRKAPSDDSVRRLPFVIASFSCTPRVFLKRFLHHNKSIHQTKSKWMCTYLAQLTLFRLWGSCSCFIPTSHRCRPQMFHTKMTSLQTASGKKGQHPNKQTGRPHSLGL